MRVQRCPRRSRRIARAMVPVALLLVTGVSVAAQERRSDAPTEAHGAPLTTYPRVSFKNYAPFGLQVWVHFEACATEWMHVLPAKDDGKGGTIPGGLDPQNSSNARENACMLHQVHVEADRGAPAVTLNDYFSTGTSYRAFYVLPATDQANTWQVYSEHEAPDVPDQGTGGKSPGFAITNNTLWPVAVSLNQVGCLYHDVLKPGQSMNRTTGAVWFTISAHIQPDSTDPNTDLSCAIPIVQVVAAVLESALMAGPPGWLALAGSAVGIGTAEGTAMFVPEAMAVAAAKGVAVTALKTSLSSIATALRDHQSTSVGGQYAGPPWPFRCDTKPQYSIRGGWGPTSHDPATGYSIKTGSPLKIVKTNDCGNSMMAGSVPR